MRVVDEYEAYAFGLLATDGSYEAGASRIRLSQGPKGHSVIEDLAEHFSLRTSYSEGNRALRIDFVNRFLNAKWQVPEFAGLDLMRHYIRGLVDGDGDLTWCQGAETRQPHLDFHNTLPFLITFYEDWLDTSGFAYHKRVGYNGPLMVGNWLHVGEIAAYLYEDVLISIDHKRKRAQEFLTYWVESLVDGRRSWYLQRESVRI